MVLQVIMMTKMHQEKLSEEVLEGSWIEDKKSLNKFGNRSLIMGTAC